MIYWHLFVLVIIGLGALLSVFAVLVVFFYEVLKDEDPPEWVEHSYGAAVGILLAGGFFALITGIIGAVQEVIT